MSEPFILGVDLDGVCANYTEGFRRYCAEALDRPLESFPLQRSWDFSEWGFDADMFETLHRAAITEGRIMASLNPIPGAAETLWRLSDAGIWIRIVTHRLYVNWGHQAAAGDTVAWLDEHRIPYRDLCFVGAKGDVGADAYIDDGPHNIEGLRGLGRRVIVFDQPYNQDFEGPRARNWSEVEHLVLAMQAEVTGVAAPPLVGFDPDTKRLDRAVNRTSD